MTPETDYREVAPKICPVDVWDSSKMMWAACLEVGTRYNGYVWLCEDCYNHHYNKDHPSYSKKACGRIKTKAK